MRIVATARYIDVDVKTSPSVEAEGEKIQPTTLPPVTPQPIYVPPSIETPSRLTLKTPPPYIDTSLDLRGLGILTPPETHKIPGHIIGERMNPNSNSFPLPVSHANTVWFDLSDERSVHNFHSYPQ